MIYHKENLKPRDADFDLRLAVAHRVCPPIPQTHQDIADALGVAKNAIFLIERRALQKVRNRMAEIAKEMK